MSCRVIHLQPLTALVWLSSSAVSVSVCQLQYPTRWKVSLIHRMSAESWLKVEHMDVWQPIAAPVAGDIVKLERRHVGVFVEGQVLHAWRANGRGSVVLTNLRVVNRLFSMCQFLRLQA